MLYASECRCPGIQNTEFPRAGVTAGFDDRTWVLGTKLWFSSRAKHAFKAKLCVHPLDVSLKYSSLSHWFLLFFCLKEMPHQRKDLLEKKYEINLIDSILGTLIFTFSHHDNSISMPVFQVGASATQPQVDTL